MAIGIVLPQFVMDQRGVEKWAAAVDLQPTTQSPTDSYGGYYTQRDDTYILLLAGGDKSTQNKDIATAIRLARTFGAQ